MSFELFVVLSTLLGLSGTIGAWAFARHNKRLQSALKHNQSLLATEDALLDAAQDGYIWIDTHNCVQYANPAAQRMLGKTRDKLVGIPVTRVIPELKLPPERIRETLSTPPPLPAPGNHPEQPHEGYAQVIHVNAHSELKNVLIQIPASDQTAEPLAPIASTGSRSPLHQRHSILQKLRDAVAIASAQEKRIAVIVIDLDQFQRINESLGHTAGDLILDVTATRLSKHTPQPHILGRLGSDEFVAILLDPPDEEACIAQIQQLQAHLARPIQLNDQRVVVTASVGLSISSEWVQSADALLQQADMAVHTAKRGGRNQIFVQNELADSSAENELKTELALRTALNNHEVWLAYQPQVDLSSGEIIGCEALIRWRHPELGQVPPDLFIPIAESSGLIASLGRWVLHTACLDAKRMLEYAQPGFLMSVNVSASQFLAGTVIEDVESALHEAQLPAHCLELEITESLLIHDHEQTNEALQTLRKMGVRVALDDFGTGYSSLAYLLRYPIDKLKIDRSFIEHLKTNTHDATLASAIIAMGHQLGMTVVAEGVEESGQGQFLSQHSCDIAQGYLYGRAVPADAFMRQIRGESAAAIPADGSP